MPVCEGNRAEHCCTFGGVTCPHLEQGTVEGRRWVCGLLRVHGSWDAVHRCPEYVADVQPFWDSYPMPGLSCGDWPQATELEVKVRQGQCDPAAACCWGELWRP